MAGSVFRVPSRAFVRKRKSEAAPHVTQPVHACVYACFTNYSRPLSHNRCLGPGRKRGREKERVSGTKAETGWTGQTDE